KSSPVLKSSAVLSSSAQPVSDPGANSSGALAPETLQDVPTAPTDEAYPLLKGVSANRGLTDEVQSIVQASTTSSTAYRIQVSAYGTSSGDYALRVLATPSGIAACPAQNFMGTVGSPTPVAGVTTPAGLIVYNTLTTSPALLGTNGASGSTLYGLAAASHSWLMPVTPAAADQWTTPKGGSFDCAPVAANATVQAIADAIRNQKAGPLPGLQSVVIVGGDDKLPFYRVPDTTSISNEIEHSDAVGTDNPISASQRSRFFLSDDPYTSLNPIPWLDRSFYVPDLAVGRLVESDAEISGQIAAYITTAGTLTASTALITGYDFLADGSASVVDTLGGSGLAIDPLIDKPGVSGASAWTAAQLKVALERNPDIAVLNAHFSQYQMLSSKGDTTQTADILDLLPGGTSPDLPTGVLSGSIMFSAGCHGGMSVPDAYATNNGTYPLLGGSTAGIAADWAQALSNRGANVWIANTGFGYGSVGDVALSERLMALYAKYLVDPTTAGAGDALVKAKQEYFATQGVYGSYDEKSLQQVVFYGIPSFHFDPTAAIPRGVAAAGSTAPVSGPGLTPTPSTSPATAGMQSAAISPWTFNATRRVVDGQVAYTVGGDTLVVNGYPIAPRTSVDVTSTVSGLTARGAAIESMQTTLVPNVLPQIARATSDLGGNEPAARPATVVFPTAFQTIGGNAQHQRLVVFPGQFSDVDATPGADTGTQLLLNNASFTVYYADTTTAGDVTRPFIAETTAAAGSINGSPGVVLFRVKTDDPPGLSDVGEPTGVRRVLVQYDDSPGYNTPHTWKAIELQKDSKGTWVGALTTPNTDGRYFVQAFDGAGNQAISQFKGNF
ncbi:MAG: hypothetical protein RLZZ623_3252, partial [Actinomycetota bacterium]